MIQHIEQQASKANRTETFGDRQVILFASKMTVHQNQNTEDGTPVSVQLFSHCEPGAKHE